MPYPDEIIEKLKNQYNLSQEQQQQLRTSLLEPDVQLAVENGKFDPERLIIKLERLGMEEQEIYVSMPSIAAKEIVNNLAELENWRNWEGLKANFEKLNNIPTNRLHDKKYLAVKISGKILENFISLGKFIFDRPTLIEEYNKLSNLLPQYMNALVESIQGIAQEYFSELFKKTGRQIRKIEFFDKKNGVQLGTIMSINYTETKKKNELEDKEEAKPPRSSIIFLPTSSADLSHMTKYRIKTHQNGSTSEVSSTGKVDPKEPFVYKVFEYIGYGPKTHYFFNRLSSGGFFIATQDLESTKDAGKKKSFTHFGDMQKIYDAEPHAEKYEDARKNVIRLDMLARIFRLTDLTTNSDNYGFVTVNKEQQKKIKWKIVDFRIPEQPEFYVNEKILHGFVKGNTEFGYDFSSFLKYVLKDHKYMHKKFTAANQVLNELSEGRICQKGKKMPLLKALETAHSEIITYFKQYGKETWVTEDKLQDFEKYYKAVKVNFTVISSGIEKVNKEYEDLRKPQDGSLFKLGVFKTTDKPDQKIEAQEEPVPETIKQILSTLS